jgi:3-oxoacyl-[acyl-carrier protein] reductase
VSLVMPGSVDTEFGSTGFGGDPESASSSQERIPSEWKIAPDDIADIVVCVLKMPGRTTVSRIEVRPSRPPRKS